MLFVKQTSECGKQFIELRGRKLIHVAMWEAVCSGALLGVNAKA